MITGGKIVSVEAKRFSPETTKGLKINISIDDVKTEGNNLTLSYTYTVTYEEAVGELVVKGELYAVEDNAAEIEKEWKGNKKTLPEAFANVVLNTINYTASVNGTFVVRPVNLPSPMLPPRFTISKKEKK
ncbi:hypothetical protein J7J90_00450 [Candidatus Micrarchaeota archaeon]|nr:hypothetical protein [Candidatus Micrarchaeota archaeon]